jgi:inner membrane protein
MVWWLWFVLGLALLLVELLTPGGFYLLFFGVGALAVGGVALFLLAMPPWLQWFLFLVVSVISLMLFRRMLLAKLERPRPEGPVDSLVGQIALPANEIAPGAVGKAELRGSAWNARNVSPVALRPEQRCRVERVEGLMLFIRPEEN